MFVEEVPGRAEAAWGEGGDSGFKFFADWLFAGGILLLVLFCNGFIAIDYSFNWCQGHLELWITFL